MIHGLALVLFPSSRDLHGAAALGVSDLLTGRSRAWDRIRFTNWPLELSLMNTFSILVFFWLLFFDCNNSYKLRPFLSFFLHMFIHRCRRVHVHIKATVICSSNSRNLLKILLRLQIDVAAFGEYRISIPDAVRSVDSKPPSAPEGLDCRTALTKKRSPLRELLHSKTKFVL